MRLLGLQREWGVELNDGLWVCNSAVSGNCGATGAAGGCVAKWSRNVLV